jgi:hypothetical protein
MGAKKVYTNTFDWEIAGADLMIATFEIGSAGREMKINSIGLNWLITNAVTGIPEPHNTHHQQKLILQVGTIGVQMSAPFSNYSIPPFFNGDIIYITERGQWLFSTFYVRNVLALQLEINNYVPAPSLMGHLVSIMFEVDERIIYN